MRVLKQEEGRRHNKIVGFAACNGSTMRVLDAGIAASDGNARIQLLLMPEPLPLPVSVSAKLRRAG